MWIAGQLFYGSQTRQFPTVASIGFDVSNRIACTRDCLQVRKSSVHGEVDHTEHPTKEVFFYAGCDFTDAICGVVEANLNITTMQTAPRHHDLMGFLC